MANFVAIDFETANNDRDSACAVGLVRVESGQIVSKERRLINPETDYFKYTDCNKIKPEDVANAPLFDSVWRELSPLLEGVDFLVAHNASFDKSVLHQCCDKYKIERPKHPFTCSIKAAKACWKLPNYQLNTVSDHLRIELNHHEALSDATACANIMIKAFGEGYKI